MVVNRPLLWMLIAICCVPSVAVLVRIRLRAEFYSRHSGWREAPLAFAGRLADGVLFGLGVGLSVAAAVLVVAGIRARLV